MRIYKLINTARSNFWCVAPNESEAKALAMGYKHARKEENLKVLDLTEELANDPGISKILRSKIAQVIVHYINGQKDRWELLPSIPGTSTMVSLIGHYLSSKRYATPGEE